MVAIWRASTTGLRAGSTSTLIPNLSRRVRAAMAAMATIGSRKGAGPASRSLSQSESTPSVSQRAA